jgi:Cu/Ag efflux protein CusF
MTLVAALVAAPSLVLAEEKPGAQAVVMKAKGPTGAGVAQALEIQGVVTAIDKENRTVTVKGPQGNLRDIKVGEGARNFDQVKVGDMVTLAYGEAFTIALEKSKGAKPGKIVTEEFKRAAPGEKPGGKLVSQIAIVGTVTVITGNTQVVTVRGPEGKELDIKVQDEAKLKNLKIGDLVKATYTEAVVISVTAPANPAATSK